MTKVDEYINNYVERSLKHSRTVCDLLFYIFKNYDKLSFNIDRWNLLKRAVNHDNDKFTKEYMENMANFWLFKDKLSNEEKEKLNQTYINHKKFNNHHPMYFEVNNIQLNNEDICEMACDFISSGRKNDNIIVENANIWRNNFNESLKKSKLLEPYKDKFFEIFELFDKFFDNYKQEV